MRARNLRQAEVQASLIDGYQVGHRPSELSPNGLKLLMDVLNPMWKKQGYSSD